MKAKWFLTGMLALFLGFGVNAQATINTSARMAKITNVVNYGKHIPKKKVKRPKKRAKCNSKLSKKRRVLLHKQKKRVRRAKWRTRH